MDWVTRITDFFNNIKTLITDFLDFFPTEITSLLIPTLLIVCGIYVYRFVR